jgi:hypothetical protein
MNFLEHVDVMVGKVFAKKTVTRVQRSIHSEVSLYVLGSFIAGVRLLCMEPIL